MWSANGSAVIVIRLLFFLWSRGLQNDIESAAAFQDCLELVGQETYDNLVNSCIDDLRVNFNTKENQFETSICDCLKWSVNVGLLQLTDDIAIAGNIWEVLQETCVDLANMGINSQGTILTTDAEYVARAFGYDWNIQNTQILNF